MAEVARRCQAEGEERLSRLLSRFEYGLVLLLCEVGFSVASMILSVIFAFLGPLALLWTLVSWLVSLAFLALLILGIVNAAQGLCKELPLIGRIRILK